MLILLWILRMKVYANEVVKFSSDLDFFPAYVGTNLTYNSILVFLLKPSLCALISD